jgi:hypothetical protein
MIEFLKAREEILKVGLEDIIQSGDQTEIHFVLKDGTTLTLYTTEVEVEDVEDLSYVQSEVRFMKGDLA